MEDGTLTNGGLLFSDNCNVYQSRVFCTRWDGLTKTDAINDAEYSGNMLFLLKMMTGFIKSSTAKRWFKLPDYRLNFPEYADRAILECCVNHLIHRDMTEVGSEVHVDIYDNRIEFYSPGGMFDGTRIQDRDILKVPSERRNPIIADVFTQLDLIEKRGSGFQKITQKKFSTTPKPIGETAQKILDLLTEDPYLTRQALAPILDLTPDGVKYHLNKLQKDGYLERKEGRKTGRWKVLIKK